MKLTVKKTLAIVLFLVLIAYAVIAVLPRKANNSLSDNPMMKEGDLPILIAHGGGNREFPDNTLEAFYNAYSVDKNVMMETDVSITKDGVVILSHDTRIDRKTNSTGAIIDWNYSDLIAEKVDFGYTNPTDANDCLSGDLVKFTNEKGNEVTPLDVEYPEGVEARDSKIFYATTLDELLKAFPENKVNVEIKQSGDVGLEALRAVLEVVENNDAFDRVVLASFHSEIYDEFKRLQEEKIVPDNFMYSPGTSGVVNYYLLFSLGLDNFFNDGIAVFQLPTDDYVINLANKRLVKNAHKHNIAVHYWTINDKEDMRYLIEIGADGIMTDYPHRLAEVYAEMKK